MANEDIYLNRIIKLKESIRIFRDVDEYVIKKIVKDIQFIQYNMHEKIIVIGEKKSDIYLLIEGECRVQLENNITVGIIKKNQLFGEFSPITKTPRSATVRASVPCKVISFKIDFDFLESEISGYAILYKNFVEEVINKLNVTNLEKRKGAL